MVTEAKKKEVEALRERFNEANLAVLTSITGVKVNDVTTLRRDLRASNTSLKVVKNTLAKIAAEGTPLEDASSQFQGPVSIAFSFGDDPSAPAKALLDFAKDNEGLKVLGAVIEGSMLDASEVKKLADLPPKPVVQSMLLGLMQTPARNFLGVMEGAARKMLYALNAIAEKKKEEDQA